MKRTTRTAEQAHHLYKLNRNLSNINESKLNSLVEHALKDLLSEQQTPTNNLEGNDWVSATFANAFKLPNNLTLNSSKQEWQTYFNKAVGSKYGSLANREGAAAYNDLMSRYNQQVTMKRVAQKTLSVPTQNDSWTSKTAMEYVNRAISKGAISQSSFNAWKKEVSEYKSSNDINKVIRATYKLTDSKGRPIFKQIQTVNSAGNTTTNYRAVGYENSLSDSLNIQGIFTKIWRRGILPSVGGQETLVQIPGAPSWLNLIIDSVVDFIPYVNIPKFVADVTDLTVTDEFRMITDFMTELPSEIDKLVALSTEQTKTNSTTTTLPKIRVKSPLFSAQERALIAQKVIQNLSSSITENKITTDSIKLNEFKIKSANGYIEFELQEDKEFTAEMQKQLIGVYSKYLLEDPKFLPDLDTEERTKVITSIVRLLSGQLGGESMPVTLKQEPAGTVAKLAISNDAIAKEISDALKNKLISKGSTIKLKKDSAQVKELQTKIEEILAGNSSEEEYDMGGELQKELSLWERYQRGGISAILEAIGQGFLGLFPPIVATTLGGAAKVGSVIVSTFGILIFLFYAIKFGTAALKKIASMLLKKITSTMSNAAKSKLSKIMLGNSLDITLPKMKKIIDLLYEIKTSTNTKQQKALIKEIKPLLKEFGLTIDGDTLSSKAAKLFSTTNVPTEAKNIQLGYEKVFNELGGLNAADALDQWYAKTINDVLLPAIKATKGGLKKTTDIPIKPNVTQIVNNTSNTVSTIITDPAVLRQRIQR